jgi:FkbM family methyltransferase
MSDNKLIFDLGLHKGFDTIFYLAKGFRVIGLEAVPELCQTARTLNEKAVANGQLTIVNRALHNKSDMSVTFFVNPNKDDWGSLDRNAAEKGDGNAVEIAVQSITLSRLFALYGLPYYIKCDLEGGDAIFAAQLLAVPYKPDFVSIEATSADDIALLRACGYTKFQIVNQYLNYATRAPNPSREGIFVDQNFTDEMSGLFGHDLPADGWRSFADTMSEFLDWYNLRARHLQLAIGWLDIHATRA